jgi:hypothetical protein
MPTLFTSILLALATPAWAVPTTLTHQGRIAGPDGAPLDGVHALTFRVYGEPTGGSPVWADTYAPRFESGVYTVRLGEDGTNPLDTEMLGAYPLWMELEVDGVVLTPRQPLTSAPYARVAGVAESLSGGAVDATGVSVGGVEVIDADGRWVGESPVTGWDRVSGVPADLADGDDDSLAGISCDEGAILAYVAGTWTCGTDAVGLDAAAVDARIDARGYATDAELDALALTCDALTGAIDTLDGRITVLEDGSLVLAADLDTLAGRVGTLETDGDALAGDLAALDGRLSGDLDMLAGRVGTLETAGDALAGDLASLDGRLSADLDTLAGRVDTLETDGDALAARVGTLEGAVDADTLADLSCLDGELAAWDATLAAWTCAPDRVLTEAEVDAYVADNGYASAASVSTLSGRVGTLESDASALGARVGTLETDAVALGTRVGAVESTVASDGLTLAEVLADLADVASDLASVSARVTALEGAVATLAASAFSGSFLDLTDVPTGLADGDDDTLAGMACADGEVAQWDAAAGTWTCAPDATVTEADVEAWVTDDALALPAGTTIGGAEPASIPSGVIVMWSGATTSIPAGWALCNGTSGTPDLRDRFVIGAGSTYAVGATGGTAAGGTATYDSVMRFYGGCSYASGCVRVLTSAPGGTPYYYALAYIMKL